MAGERLECLDPGGNLPKKHILGLFLPVAINHFIDTFRYITHFYQTIIVSKILGSCCFLFFLMILMRKNQGFMSHKFTKLITKLFSIEWRLGMQATKTNIGNLPAKIDEWIKIKYPAGDSTASLLVGTFHQLTEKCRRVNSDYWHQNQKWLEYFSIWYWHLPIVGIKLPWNFFYSNSCLPRNAD